MLAWKARWLAAWPMAMSLLRVGARDRSYERAEVPEGSKSPAAAGSEVALPVALTGIWTVVGHHSPGVSAMSDAEAATRHGATVRLTVTEGLSPGNHCDAPTYATRTVDKDRFLASEYHLPPGSLAPLDAGH